MSIKDMNHHINALVLNRLIDLLPVFDPTWNPEIKETWFDHWSMLWKLVQEHMVETREDNNAENHQRGSSGFVAPAA